MQGQLQARPERAIRRGRRRGRGSHQHAGGIQGSGVMEAQDRGIHRRMQAQVVGVKPQGRRSWIGVEFGRGRLALAASAAMARCQRPNQIVDGRGSEHHQGGACGGEGPAAQPARQQEAHQHIEADLNEQPAPRKGCTTGVLPEREQRMGQIAPTRGQ